MAQSRKTSKSSKSASKKSAASSNSRTPARDKHRDNEAEADEHPTVTMVRGLAQIVEDHGLSELIVDLPDATLTLRRPGEGGASPASAHHPIPGMATAVPAMAPPLAPALPAAPAAPIAAPAPVDDNHHIVTSPFVGTFYRRPNPESEPYVELGARVDKGQALCIVEAMKLMNEIEADAGGTVTAVLVEDGEPVEYGQELFKIAPL